MMHSMEQGLRERNERIKTIYELVIAWENSGLTMVRFCRIIGLPPKTLSYWRSKFIPGHPNASEHWMVIGGIIEYRPIIPTFNVREMKSKWLDHCQKLEKLK